VSWITTNVAQTPKNAVTLGKLPCDPGRIEAKAVWISTPPKTIPQTAESTYAIEIQIRGEER